MSNGSSPSPRPSFPSAEVRSELVDALLLDLIGPIADPDRADERIE